MLNSGGDLVRNKICSIYISNVVLDCDNYCLIASPVIFFKSKRKFWSTTIP